ncbi:hypothetical protein ACFLZW_03690 [Chloroflexota bacterium]
MLYHLLPHSMGHRSEAAAFLTALGHSPGDLDLIFYLNGQNQTNDLVLTWMEDEGQLGIDAGVVINESGADMDSRIEGDTDANLIFVYAGNDRVGIGTGTPAVKLDVRGVTRIGDGTNYIEVGSDGTVRLVAAATAWEDLRFPASKGKPGAAQPDWTPTDTDTGSVVWGLEYAWANVGVPLGIRL